MILWDYATVLKVEREGTEKQVLQIRLESGETRRALNFPRLCGRCREGDRLAVNKTAVELALGTGGYDFVVANLSRLPIGENVLKGHIIKNRYTPLQMAVHCGEEKDHPLFPEGLDEQAHLDGTPVMIFSLHSMLPVAALILKKFRPEWNLVYCMTDGTALPVWLSEHVEALKEMNVLHGTITCQQSFGGDIEAVNKFSGLLLAKYALNADVILLGPGPGSVGTGHPWGFSAIETGECINAVNILSGTPVTVPRISFSDPRERHRGLSHHLLTVLTKVALTPTHLPLPEFGDDRKKYLQKQLGRQNWKVDHQLHWILPLPVEELAEILEAYPFPIRTMGRDLFEDPAFFQGAAAAAQFVLSFRTADHA